MTAIDRKGPFFINSEVLGVIASAKTEDAAERKALHAAVSTARTVHVVDTRDLPKPPRRKLATKLEVGDVILVDTAGGALAGTRRTRESGTVLAARITAKRYEQRKTFRAGRGTITVVRLTTTAGVFTDVANGGHTLAKQVDIETLDTRLEAQRTAVRKQREREARQARTGLCEFELEPLWRDEDVALQDPKLAGISTCQRAPGHTTGYHSARTDAQIAEVERYLDEQSSIRRETARELVGIAKVADRI